MPLRQREKKSDHRWQKSPEYELVCSGDYRKWDGLSEGEGTERRVPVYELPRYAYDFAQGKTVRRTGVAYIDISIRQMTVMVTKLVTS